MPLVKRKRENRVSYKHCVPSGTLNSLEFTLEHGVVVAFFDFDRDIPVERGKKAEAISFGARPKNDLIEVRQDVIDGLWAIDHLAPVNACNNAVVPIGCDLADAGQPCAPVLWLH